MLLEHIFCVINGRAAVIWACFKAPSLALLCSAALAARVFLDRFPFIPVRTRGRHRQLPKLKLKLDGNIGPDLVSTNHSDSYFGCTRTSELC